MYNRLSPTNTYSTCIFPRAARYTFAATGIYHRMLRLLLIPLPDNIFKRHFVYWLTSLVASDISDTEKRELVAAINPLLRKQVNITSDFDERIYSPLTKPILAGDYDETVRKITKIKKSRARKDKIKSFFGLG